MPDYPIFHESPPLIPGQFRTHLTRARKRIDNPNLADQAVRAVLNEFNVPRELFVGLMFKDHYLIFTFVTPYGVLDFAGTFLSGGASTSSKEQDYLKYEYCMENGIPYLKLSRTLSPYSDRHMKKLRKTIKQWLDKPIVSISKGE